MTTEILPILDSQEVLLSLTKMKSFIESANYADWSEFNSAKKHFLDTFKTYPSPDKQKVWKEFVEVADSARAIRKVQEEEGQFAAEMISKALEAHENDLQSILSFSYEHPLFDKVLAFKSVKEDLKTILSRLKFLSQKADQLQSLRQELSKTGMRLSVKGKLFDRLSHLGDKVFPVKKSLNQELVEKFLEGLNQFVKVSSKAEDGQQMLFEIRMVQSFLKEMTLKKQQYDQIKNTLDPLWKKALIVKDQKESALLEASQKSQELKKALKDEFELIKALVDEGKDQDALKAYDAACLKLKDRQLQKHDFRDLKIQLDALSKPVFDRMQEMKDQKQQMLKAQATLKDDKKQKLYSIVSESLDLEERKNALHEALELNLNVDDVYRFKLKFLSNLFASCQDSSELEGVYLEVKKMQQSIRGALASSALDFTLSMNLQESYEETKELLNHILKKLD